MIKNQNTAPEINNLEHLVNAIQQTNQFFLAQVQRQVNTALTLRNWIIGYYIVEYEQHGEDRAKYGQQFYKVIATNLKDCGLASLGERNLYLCKDFYKAYPDILQTLSAKSYLNDFQSFGILQTASAKLNPTRKSNVNSLRNDPDLLLNRLSFSHFIELLKADTQLKRSFYEIQSIKNNWGVRELKRAIDSMLFERTGLSKNKQAVFNYYKENEMQKGDNPPLGIILCAGKDEALARYATMGLPQKIFVSKYLVNLPTEKELQRIIEEGQEKVKD